MSLASSPLSNDPCNVYLETAAEANLSYYDLTAKARTSGGP